MDKITGRIRTEAGDPVRAAEAAQDGAIVDSRRGESTWLAQAVKATTELPAFRSVTNQTPWPELAAAELDAPSELYYGARIDGPR